MAGKVNMDVISRRLKPIYDWLEIGKNRKAVQEAEKVLRKQPNLQCASVLKALALLRLGKQDECRDSMSTVIAEGTTNDDTLQCLSMCYKEMNQPEEICKLYENAVKMDPNNEEILSHYFMSYVRVGNYKKQQQIALQLYRLNPKNPYYFWAIMSNIMQSHTSKDPMTKKLTLQLADRMVEKFVSEGKIDSEAEVLTYIYILEMQGKYAEALKVIEGPLSKRIVHQMENFINLKKSSYYSHLKQYESAACIYISLITQELDNWQHYVNYCDSVVAAHDVFLNDSENQDPLMKFDKIDKNPIHKAAKFLLETRSSALNGTERNRSPLLGILQLALKLKERGMEDKIKEYCGSIVDHLAIYIERQGNKMCCFGDIVNFVSLVPKEEVDNFMEKIKSFIDFDTDHGNFMIDRINRHLIHLQLSLKLGVYNDMAAEELIEEADNIVKRFISSVQFVEEILQSDIRPDDTYLILASHLYMSAITILLERCEKSTNNAQESAALKLLVTEIVIKTCTALEYGAALSPGNCQYKLLLVKIYNKLGASKLSYQAYEKLDLKHIQLDSLGHVLTFQIAECGRTALAESIFSDTLKFFAGNFKDISDPLIMSYKYGSLTRIPEFVEFRERLNNSLHFAFTTGEQMILDILRENSSSGVQNVIKDMHIDPVNDKINWDDLRDNRDLKVMNQWFPAEKCASIKIQAETFIDGKVLLKLRNFLLRILGAGFLFDCYNIEDCNRNGSISSEVDNKSMPSCDFSTFKNLITELSAEDHNCDKYRGGNPSTVLLLGIDTPRIYLYSKENYLRVFINHAEVLLYIYQCTCDDKVLKLWSGKCLKDCSRSLDELVSNHLPLINERLTISSSYTLPGISNETIYKVFYLIETISLCVVLASFCNRLLTPIKKNVARKNKKKKGNIFLPDIIPDFNSFLLSMQVNLEYLKSAINSILCKVIEKKIHNRDAEYDSVCPNVDFKSFDHKVICDGIDESYIESLNSFQQTVSMKLKFVSSLKIEV